MRKNDAGMVAQYSNGTSQGNPDGYKRLVAGGTPWNRVITVWRNGTFTPVFDQGYTYLVSSLLTRDNQMVIDVASQTDRNAGQAMEQVGQPRQLGARNPPVGRELQSWS